MNRFRWFGHIMCMKEERLPKKMLHTKLARNRIRGRHRKTRWLDGFPEKKTLIVTRREDSKIRATKIKFLRAILNKKGQYNKS